MKVLVPISCILSWHKYDILYRYIYPPSKDMSLTISSVHLMSLLIRYAHIPFYFCFSFTFSTLLIHHYAPPLWHNHTQSHSLHWTNLTHLMDTWFMIHMYLLLFLVSPTCPLLQSDQSQALAPCSQALSITSAYARFLVFHLYLTCLYLPFAQIIIREEPHNCLYQFPPELRFSTYTLHHLALILHYFASHCTAMIPLSLLATTHLETIPCPQIAPPQSSIGFILRSLALWIFVAS